MHFLCRMSKLKFKSKFSVQYMYYASHFLNRVFDDIVEECRSAIIYDNMNISRLMVHDQQVKEIIQRRKNREAKWAKSFKGCSSKGRLEVQDKLRFNKRFSN